jgi:molybdopterin-synthase adenylyltransferase
MTEPMRFDRQAAFLPPERLKTLRAVVIGVGAIGRQVALQLAAAGVGELVLIDFDTVDVVNLGPQGYRPDQVGFAKVACTQQDCQGLNPDIVVTALNQRVTLSDLQPVPERQTVIFCCVDKMEARSFIWRGIEGEDGVSAFDAGLRLFVDGRMSSMTIRIVTSSEIVGRNYYSRTLFSEAEAQEASCTARSTVFTANIAAGLMVTQLVKWIREFPLEQDILFNLLSLELSCDVESTPP